MNHPADPALESALRECWPQDLPAVGDALPRAARHLAMVLEANRTMNLTRITAPREAAAKHVFDSLAPWQALVRFRSLLDLGSGAGYPGIPLALVFPDREFVLAESVGKKARFLESVVAELQLANVRVVARRAEEWLRRNRVDAVLARAAGSTQKVLQLLPDPWSFSSLLLYKGPAVLEELEACRDVLRTRRLRGEVRCWYDLPHGLGRHCLLEITASRGS
jgi:16S rRNA (guanine527-N7)-methyltransferase